MDRQAFTATATKLGLTVKQLIKLSMIQSEVYHNIKFNGAEDRSDLKVTLGDIQHDRRKMAPIEWLAQKGFIELVGDMVTVTPQGWAVSCNSGASVFLGGCDDADITDGPNGCDPVTNFSEMVGDVV